MKATFRLVVTVLLLVGWGLAASSLHVVWNGDQPVLLTKDHLGLRDTFVNASHWTPADLANHPALAKRLIATGRTDVLPNAFVATGSDAHESVSPSTKPTVPPVVSQAD